MSKSLLKAIIKHLGYEMHSTRKDFLKTGKIISYSVISTRIY